MIYRSIADPLLEWPTAEAVEAWKAEHPDDIRGAYIECVRVENV